VEVVEVHDTITGDAVGGDGELQFGNQVSLRASERGHHD
jgi:hypothetical protein